VVLSRFTEKQAKTNQGWNIVLLFTEKGIFRLKRLAIFKGVYQGMSVLKKTKVI